ncbi:hypothetical protein RhiirA4_471469 [Rhizophagus irregularis]|uniref:Uncharacterized protein n=1 Tax=Rhizophagus irregularis TaxID=588596 RepID=A0A2I1H397_9GLOM|nr:hypothetical protein RhiirA4_471469 [Rhizophagus irregularis]
MAISLKVQLLEIKMQLHGNEKIKNLNSRAGDAYTKINNKLYTHKESNIIGIELDNEGDDDIENEEITNEEPSGEDSSKFSSKEESGEESAEDSDDEFGKESNGDYSSEEFSEADEELNEETDESQSSNLSEEESAISAVNKTMTEGALFSSLLLARKNFLRNKDKKVSPHSRQSHWFPAEHSVTIFGVSPRTTFLLRQPKKFAMKNSQETKNSKLSKRGLPQPVQEELH